MKAGAKTAGGKKARPRSKRPTRPGFQEELRLHAEGLTLVAGVDEVGRGPLAGPVMAGAVILPADWIKRRRRRPTRKKNADPRDLLNDSKKLTAAQREAVYEVITETALAWGIGTCSAADIDEAGIVAATRRAMCEAVRGLAPQPDALLVDAVELTEPGLAVKSIIRGDALCGSIAAASIVAKVARDRLMAEMHERHPGYGFDRNKGYATAEHLRSLRERGPCEIHRRRFEPLRTQLLQPKLI